MPFEFSWINILLFGFINYKSAQSDNTNTSDLFKIRKNNVFDYNFDDWEESTQSVYFNSDFTNDTADSTTTVVDTTIASTNAIETTNTQPSSVDYTTYTQDVTEIETNTNNVTVKNDTIPNTSDITDISNINDTNDVTTMNITESTSETVTEDTESTTEATSTATTLNDTDLDEVLYNYLTTPHKPELLIPDNILHYENTTEITPGTSTVHPIVLEVKDLTESLKFGFFTTTMITLLRIVIKKDEDALQTLLIALNTEVMRLRTAAQFRMFGPVGNYAISAIAQMMALAPPDVVQAQASFLNFALTTRKTSLKPEINAIFDLADNMYTEDDALNVITCLVNIENFPNTTKNGNQICADLFEAALFKPYSRIIGTNKEKLLVLEIENIISKNIEVDQVGLDRRMGVHTFIPIRNYFKQKQKKHRNHLRKSLRTKVTARSFRKYENIRFAETTEYFVVTDLSYFRNTSIKRMLKKKQRGYKRKWKKIREKERIIGTKRGKTSTTTATISTIKPTMHRSKYYWRKYKLGDLYRMKTTTPSTTKKKKYPWMRRQYADMKYKTQDEEIDYGTSDSVCSTNSDETSTCVDRSEYISDYNRDENTEYEKTTISSRYAKIQFKPLEGTNNENSREQYRKSFDNNYYYPNKNIVYETTGQNPIINFHGDVIKSTLRVILLGKSKVKSNLRKITENSEYSSEEKYLKANILDALVHGEKHGLGTYRDMRRHIVEEVKSFQSYSNEEPTFKANVYRAFGYSKGFAESLKKSIYSAGI